MQKKWLSRPSMEIDEVLYVGRMLYYIYLILFSTICEEKNKKSMTLENLFEIFFLPPFKVSTETWNEKKNTVTLDTFLSSFEEFYVCAFINQ